MGQSGNQKAIHLSRYGKGDVRAAEYWSGIKGGSPIALKLSEIKEQNNC